MSEPEARRSLDEPEGHVAIGGQPHASGNWTFPFSGCIDEFRVSDVVRYTQDFVPGQKQEPDEHTLLHYHCDDRDPRTGYLRDSSGNAHHGMMVGGVHIARRDEEEK